MVSRLFRRLLPSGEEAEERPIRPNQLRLQDVVAERQRREAARQPPAPDTSPSAARHPVSPPPRRERSQSLRAAMASRDGLRQALLLREVLDPPLSLRDLETWTDRF